MPAEVKKKFEALEKKIQNLISSHQELRAENEELKSEIGELEKALEAERGRIKRMDEGYQHLKTSERTASSKNIKALKLKVESIISEIDKSVALTDNKSK